MKRNRNPNKDLFSPPGGKLDILNAESPSECAVREAFEECSIKSNAEDWKLCGILTEKNYPDAGHIMIFIMSYNKSLNELPPDCNEGSFIFIHPDKFNEFSMPETDKRFLWKNVINYNGEVFLINLDCSNYPEIIQY